MPDSNKTKVISEKKKERGKKTKRINKTRRRYFIKDDSKLPLIERKYCSCLQKVRTQQYNKNPELYKKTKKRIRTGKSVEKRGEIYSEYAICNKSVYQRKKLKRNRVINCSLSMDFDKLTLEELEAYAIDKNIPVQVNKKNVSRTQLLNAINDKIKKEK